MNMNHQTPAAIALTMKNVHMPYIHVTWFKLTLTRCCRDSGGSIVGMSLSIYVICLKRSFQQEKLIAEIIKLLSDLLKMLCRNLE